ncbi:hypothetical protein F2P79_025857 [Pimephales promelas]|nr:hypothetical protein F2P79_025857 [Pimephales promelas]
MMTDKASKSCTPVKEMDASKPSQSSDTDDEIEDHSDGVKTDEVRRSRRKRIPTEKMVAYQREESQKAEKRLMHSYEQWKAEARKAREQLKTDISESQLATLIDTLENERDNVMNAYMRVRSCVTPPTDTRRRIDACDAVTKDIVKIAYERISGVDGDLDVETKKERLRELLDRDYARSVYGSTVSRISSKSSTPISQPSLNSILMAKRIEAEAELAAKEAEYAAIMEEKEQRERIQLLEERQKRELDAQKSEYERLLAVKEVRAARARLKVYDKGDVSSDDQNDVLQQPVSIPTQVYSSSIEPTLNAKASSPTTNVDVSYLAQAVQDSITLNRLPMPEPTVFSGDPIHFIEWKASFQSLIDKRHISSADKLYYLKKYVTGSARKTLEGMFYRNDEEAYKDAWKRLQDRYGQPFIVQRAFREKLACWPRIQPKDAEGLRNFSDFLNACKDAMPHVKGLEILNDCEENRKLVSKLPDWAAARWNRQATQTLNETQEFPPFHDFAKFMSLEAEVACNPVTSFYALHASEANKDKQNLKVSKNKANVFHTKIITQNEDPKHTERRQFVKDSKLCYGCLKLSHSARDCRSRHNCVICKGRHPTCLHDDSFIRRVKFSPAQSPENTHERVVTTSLSVESGCASANTSMIVPVWLSSQNDPTSERLVYALLDTQSDTVFVEYAVSQSLKVDSCPVTLRLTTMVGRDSLISSERVSGLRVRGFNSTVILDLPPAYTKECIPVDRAHIPTSETARCWKHLAPLADRIPLLQDCEVGLLLGYNCPRALAPREVILGADNEPYGVRTDLGWSIVGPSLTHESQSGVSMCHRVSIKEIPSVTPADVIKVLESDFRDTKENTKVVSQEDIVFLNKLEENIKTNEDGHLEMPLPFKKRPYLPDNEVIQAVARLLRRVRKDKSSDHSTVAEREDAKSIIIKDLQSQTYAEEIALLRKGKQLSRNNRLYNLDAFVDHDGLLKVGGRLCNSSVPYSIKYPVILPKEHHLTKLLIADCHEKTEHQGKGLTINEIRSRGYWITGVNRAVASFVRRCVGCRKLRRPTEEQKMANLPSERLDPSPPFTYCGMDVFGPFIIKQSRKSYKRYGLLFTCFCCRGIHIEMLDDMSTDAFINGLRCFIAIRGAVRLIRCDQGSNFIGAKNEFAKAMTEIDTNRLVTYLAGKQCDFVFNAPHSSHTGGVWERQIRTVRSVLNSTLSLSSGRLDDSSLRTFFYEAMAIVNSRPLTVDNLNDPKSPEPLTPNHLLTLKTTQALPPPGKFVREDVYARKRWRHVQYLAEQFWGRWQKEYVSNIATRQRWLTPRRNMQVGDIVLEKADDLPRNEWRLAKVIETVVDKDGLVRRAKIRFGDRKLGKDGKRLNKPSIVDRPVQKLVLLLEAS